MGSCSELMFWSMFSSFGMIGNISPYIYNYLIATHPLYVLFYHALVYILMSFYIFYLGQSVTDMNKKYSSSDKINKYTNLIYTDISDPNTDKERVNTQTKRSAPRWYQKGKYRRLG